MFTTLIPGLVKPLAKKTRDESTSSRGFGVENAVQLHGSVCTVLGFPAGEDSCGVSCFQRILTTF